MEFTFLWEKKRIKPNILFAVEYFYNVQNTPERIFKQLTNLIHNKHHIILGVLLAAGARGGRAEFTLAS